jgi:hypothetical protein
MQIFACNTCKPATRAANPIQAGFSVAGGVAGRYLALQQRPLIFDNLQHLQLACNTKPL